MYVVKKNKKKQVINQDFDQATIQEKKQVLGSDSFLFWIPNLSLYKITCVL